MNSQSLHLYHGGFLINSCEPLELMLNTCSHGCRGCFAVLQEPNKKANFKQIQSAIARSYQSDTLEGYLLRNQYPVVFSNHTDPFAKSNLEPANLSLAALELLTASEIPVSIQTKGGKGLLKPHNYHCAAIDLLPVPTAFYISIESLDDAIGLNWAPKAPPPSERLDLVRTLVGMGHRVTVGVNPTVPEWIADPDHLVCELSLAGAEGIWINPLHLSKTLRNAMPSGSKRKLGEQVLERAKSPRKDQSVAEVIEALRAAAKIYDIPVYQGQQWQRSDFFKPYRDIYKNSYPTQQDFVNTCWDSRDDGEIIYFEEWCDFMLQRLPSGVWPIGQHIGAVAGPAFWSKAREKIPYFKAKYGSSNRMTYRDLLALIWDYKESVLCPVNTQCFSWAGYHEGDGWGRWIDDKQHPLLIFRRKKLELFEERFL